MRKRNPQSATTSQGHVYALMRELLMNGDLACGQRLIVRDLAERFNTSPMPVREALRRLVAEGAIEDCANRGAIVPEMTLDTVADLMRIRCVTEGQAVEWAAATITGTELDVPMRINDKMELQIANGTLDSYLHLNREFHFSIYRAARSPALMQVIDRLWLRTGPWLRIFRQADVPFFGVKNHIEMLSGLQAGDGPRARRAVIADITSASNTIMHRILDHSHESNGDAP